MFAQLGTIQFGGLQTFVTYNTGEEMTLAQFALINRKPKLMAAGIGLIKLDLSIFLHVEFTSGSVEDEIEKLRTSKDNFEILPLLWGNGETFGEWVINSMEVEYTNLDALGNVYEARVNLSLLESVEDNKALQEQQNAANNAFAAGNKQPATKSKRKNTASCPKNISALVMEIKQFGAVVNDTVSVYTGSSQQAGLVARSCSAISDDCLSILALIADSKSCVYQNASLKQATNLCNHTALDLATDIILNNQAINGINVGSNIPSGITVNSDNSKLQSAITNLVSVSQPMMKTAIVQ